METHELLHLNEAFQTINEGIDLAIKGQFPVGLDGVEVHMQIKGALMLISKALKEGYTEKIKAIKSEIEKGPAQESPKSEAPTQEAPPQEQAPKEIVEPKKE